MTSRGGVETNSDWAAGTECGAWAVDQSPRGRMAHPMTQSRATAGTRSATRPDPPRVRNGNGHGHGHGHGHHQLTAPRQ
jgi:hypothetical protein